MIGLRERIKAALLLATLFSGLSAFSSASAQVDVHRYLRWKRNGQLDYRRLLQRYEAVSSFPFGREAFGYPYSAWGGLRQPRYYLHSTPEGTYVEGPYYVGSPYELRY
jgi:hypothetical protein